MNSETIGAFIIIALSIAIGGWAGYRLFKFCSNLLEHADLDQDDMFNKFYDDFEKAFNEQEQRRNTRNEQFKSSFHYHYKREEAKKASESMNLKQACEILGINEKDVKNMKMEDLKKIFRQKAMETHPDKGGSADAFRQAKDAFDFVSAAA
jgi:hypothetical protein